VVRCLLILAGCCYSAIATTVHPIGKVSVDQLLGVQIHEIELFHRPKNDA
jgi:hypothetical protein